MHVSHSTLIKLSGTLWLCIGFFLLTLGIFHLVNGEIHPLKTSISPVFGGIEEATVALVAIALLIGYMKGRFVLGKSSQRIVKRIRSFPNPTSITNIFSPAYLLLIGSMVLLGISIKYFGLPHDIRGFVDIAIGSALINGAVVTYTQVNSK